MIWIILYGFIKINKFKFLIKKKSYENVIKSTSSMFCTEIFALLVKDTYFKIKAVKLLNKIIHHAFYLKLKITGLLQKIIFAQFV